MDLNNVMAQLHSLGCKGKDKVTGFEGVVASVSFDLYGCVQIVLTPPIDKEGKLPEGRWFDAHRIELDPQLVRVMEVPSFAGIVASERTVPTGPAEKPPMR